MYMKLKFSSQVMFSYRYIWFICLWCMVIMFRLKVSDEVSSSVVFYVMNGSLNRFFVVGLLLVLFVSIMQVVNSEVKMRQLFIRYIQKLKMVLLLVLWCLWLLWLWVVVCVVCLWFRVEVLVFMFLVLILLGFGFLGVCGVCF